MVSLLAPLSQLYILVAATPAPTSKALCGSDGGFCGTGLPNVQAGSSELHTILQIVFGILSAVAVLIVMVGAFRYVMSEGNPENTNKARSTILYALIGLVIALSAEAIVSFAVSHL